jgi:Timeless protein
MTIFPLEILSLPYSYNKAYLTSFMQYHYSLATTTMSTTTKRPGMKDGGSESVAGSKGTVPVNGSNDAGAAKPRKKKKHFNAVTPLYKQSIKTSLDHRMTVEKNIVDELLLVCGVIGTTTNEGNELVPVTDCLNWLQDLQRALRRDEDLYRPISLLLGKWKVVEQKLIPLVLTCRYDTPIVLTVVKILVILTKPLSDNTKRAGRMIIDTSSQKADLPKAAQQIKLRENALAQAEQLMEYKRLIAYHPSHQKSGKISPTNNIDTRKKKKQDSGLLSIFVSLLAEPLSKAGAARSDADHLTIELVLHLIRNLLTSEPLLNSK